MNLKINIIQYSIFTFMRIYNPFSISILTVFYSSLHKRTMPRQTKWNSRKTCKRKSTIFVQFCVLFVKFSNNIFRVFILGHHSSVYKCLQTGKCLLSIFTVSLKQFYTFCTNFNNLCSHFVHLVISRVYTNAFKYERVSEAFAQSLVCLVWANLG